MPAVFPPLRRLAGLALAGAALTTGVLVAPAPRASSAGTARLPAPRPSASPTIGTVAVAPVQVLAGPVVDRAPAPIAVASPAPPACRAVVLVHGGGYFMGDSGALELSWAEPLRKAGRRVWNVDYPKLPDMPDVRYDEAEPWYPRRDLDSTPAALRTVHDRAADAVAGAVEDALVSGCPVTLVGISAGGSIVADLAHRYPAVAEAVLVAGASITPDRLGGAPLRIFYGELDDVVLPAASLETCARWQALGSSCEATGLAGEAHVSDAVTATALRYLLTQS